VEIKSHGFGCGPIVGGLGLKDRLSPGKCGRGFDWLEFSIVGCAGMGSCVAGDYFDDLETRK